MGADGAPGPAGPIGPQGAVGDRYASVLHYLYNIFLFYTDCYID